MPETLNFLSLFSGIPTGGFDLGLERAGMTCVGQVEIDDYCTRVLAKHWPDVPRHRDVRTAVNWWTARPRPAVHVLAGGFPCQPVSVAGRGLAQQDERWLWPEFRTAVRHLRPRFVVVENVPGLLGRGMGDVLGDLAACGYDAEWDCVPAAAVGANHRRDRVWIVAYPAGTRRTTGTPGASGPTRDETRRPRPDGLGSDVADADEVRRDGWSGPGTDHGRRFEPTYRGGGLADPHGPRRGPWGGLGRTWPAPVRTSWWTTEPDVGRVAHGIPGRVDRLRALGNAVVPQVAEHIGRLVMAAALPAGVP